MTTNIISNRATFVTGIDTAPEVVQIAASRHPHLSFHVMDGLDVDATRALSPTGTYTRICIDISGKAPLELICQMIAAQRSAFPEAHLIVKNEQLFDALQLAEQQQPLQPQAQQQQQDSALGVPAEAAAAPPQPAAGGAPAAAGAQQERGTPAAPAAAAAAAQQRLAALLGPERLAECELFRHQFRLVRTRPPRPAGNKPAEATDAPQEEQAQRPT